MLAVRVSRWVTTKATDFAFVLLPIPKMEKSVQGALVVDCVSWRGEKKAVSGCLVRTHMENANWVIKTWRGSSSYLWYARCWRHFQALAMEQHAAKLESSSSFNSKRQAQFHSNHIRFDMLEQQNSWWEKKSWAWLGNLKLLLQLWEWDQNRSH